MNNSQRKREEVEQHNLKYKFCSERYGNTFNPRWLSHHVKRAEQQCPDEVPWRKSWLG